MIAAIFVMAFLSAFAICYSILAYTQRSKLVISSRLNGIQKSSITYNENPELNQPLFKRILAPMLDVLGKAVLRITPKEMVSSLEQKVDKAGNPGNLAAKDWVNLQAVMVLGLPALTLFLGGSLHAEWKGLILWVFVEVAIGFVVPNFVLSKMVTQRQKVIQNSLPDVIDILTVSVEAGLGFDGALMKVVDKKPGPLASEFEKVLQEIKIGKQKKDALRDMAQRVDIQDLSAFIGSVIQADQFGVGIANVLRIQAEQMRQKRRQRAQEKAMKAPIKMLIPMVIFIFPTLFIVLLGPVVIQLMEQLGGK